MSELCPNHSNLTFNMSLSSVFSFLIHMGNFAIFGFSLAPHLSVDPSIFFTINRKSQVMQFELFILLLDHYESFNFGSLIISLAPNPQTFVCLGIHFFFGERARHHIKLLFSAHE